MTWREHLNDGLVLGDELVPPAFDLFWNTPEDPLWDVPLVVARGEWRTEPLNVDVAWAWVVQVRDEWRGVRLRLEEMEVRYPGWRRQYPLPERHQYLEVVRMSEWEMWVDQRQGREQWIRQLAGDWIVETGRRWADEWAAAQGWWRVWGVLPPRWPYAWREYLEAIQDGRLPEVSE